MTQDTRLRGRRKEKQFFLGFFLSNQTEAKNILLIFFHLSLHTKNKKNIERKIFLRRRAMSLMGGGENSFFLYRDFLPFYLPTA
jgi:hypothetical protein